MVLLFQELRNLSAWCVGLWGGAVIVMRRWSVSVTKVSQSRVSSPATGWRRMVFPLRLLEARRLLGQRPLTVSAWGFPLYRVARSTSSAARCAIIIVGALVLPDGKVGMTEASTTRRPSMPCTRNSGSTTARPSLPMRQVPTAW